MSSLPRYTESKRAECNADAQLCYTVFNIMVLLLAARFLKWQKR